MENASKALIIAGSILVTIMVISLGVMIFNNMSSSVKKNADLDEQEINSFNSRILPYLGNNISGSQVNTLIQRVRSINADSASKNNSMKIIKIVGNSGASVANNGSTSTSVETGEYYTVTGTYDNNGLITTITVNK